MKTIQKTEYVSDAGNCFDNAEDALKDDLHAFFAAHKEATERMTYIAAVDIILQNTTALIAVLDPAPEAV